MTSVFRPGVSGLFCEGPHGPFSHQGRSGSRSAEIDDMCAVICGCIGLVGVICGPAGSGDSSGDGGKYKDGHLGRCASGTQRMRERLESRTRHTQGFRLWVKVRPCTPLKKSGEGEGFRVTYSSQCLI